MKFLEEFWSDRIDMLHRCGLDGEVIGDSAMNRMAAA
jgi:hypothetical protein